MPRTYDPEFKSRAVRLVRDHLADYGSVTAASVAVGSQLGVSRETLRRWVAQAEIDDGARPGVTTAEAEEIRRLNGSLLATAGCRGGAAGLRQHRQAAVGAAGAGAPATTIASSVAARSRGSARPAPPVGPRARSS